MPTQPGTQFMWHARYRKSFYSRQEPAPDTNVRRHARLLYARTHAPENLHTIDACVHADRMGPRSYQYRSLSRVHTIREDCHVCNNNGYSIGCLQNVDPGVSSQLSRFGRLTSRPLLACLTQDHWRAQLCLDDQAREHRVENINIVGCM